MELCQYAFEKRVEIGGVPGEVGQGKDAAGFQSDDEACQTRSIRSGSCLFAGLLCAFTERAVGNRYCLKPFKIRFVAFRENIEIDQETWEGCIYLYMLNVLMKAEKSMNMRNVQAGIARAQMSGVHADVRDAAFQWRRRANCGNRD